MEEQREWIPFQEIDWADPKNNTFWIDTRDFHAGYGWRDEPHSDFDTLKKYPHFFWTQEDMVELLNSYFTQSGGKDDWRYFSLNGMDNWNLKYIRIARTDLGFIICDRSWRAIKRDILTNGVNEDSLHLS